MKARLLCRGYHKLFRRIVSLAIFVSFLTILFIWESPKSSINRLSLPTTILVVDENDLADAKIQSTPNLSLLRDEYFNTNQLVCKYPTLTIDNPEIWKHLKPVKQSIPPCDSMKNWVYVKNYTLRLAEEAVQQYGPISCTYRPIIRPDSDFTTKLGNPISPATEGMLLLSDFFRVDCQGKSKNYSNVHMGIRFDPALHLRSVQKPMVKTHLGYNILMFGFDSVSRMTFMRFLPKTYSFLIKELGAVIMKGYNIVGDGTPAALLPILTGQTEQELPESRRGRPGAETVDQFPWIWNQFRDNGYVTQWAEDMQNVGTFQYRLKGFRDPPVDHFGRPFYLYAERMSTQKPYCFGSITRLKAMLDWIHSFFDVYRDKPKFSYLFHSDYSHDTNNRLPYADNELFDFLQNMHTSGYLNNTILIIMTDHGARYSALRKTHQGKLEERLPFMSIRMPPQFQYEYPSIMKNLRLNSRRLTTPFDIHETFEHLFEFNSSNRYQSKSNRSISLFELVPENRTCEQADIAQHWCACHTWQIVSVNESIIQQCSQAAVDFMNNFIADHKQDCATLSLFRVYKASRLDVNDHFKKFVQTSDVDGRVPQFQNISSKPSNHSEFFQIQFETIPGHGQFEVTVEFNPTVNKFSIQKRHLSRMNKYGNAPNCIAWKRPEFREICYCKTLLSQQNSSTIAAIST